MGKKNIAYKRMRVDGYADMIRESLEDKGLYSKSVELTIHMLSCCLSRYAEIQAALDKDELLKTQCSRENNVKYVINPLFVMAEHQAEQIRKYLRELKLTNQSASSDSEEGNDELSKLYDALGGMENKGPRLLKPRKAVNE